MRYFEDFVVGEDEIAGTHRASLDEIAQVARAWDPQPMHLEDAGAAATAPGVHMVAITVRALVTHRPATAIIAALGWDEVRFRAPVRPGDELTVRRECIEALPSRSRPDRGVVRNRIVMLNQRDEPVLSYVDTILVRRRPSGDASHEEE